MIEREEPASRRGEQGNIVWGERGDLQVIQIAQRSAPGTVTGRRSETTRTRSGLELLCVPGVIALRERERKRPNPLLRTGLVL